MIAYVYKPKRTKAGKKVALRNYRARFRLAGEFEINDVALRTSDKQVAKLRLNELIEQAEQERAGLTKPTSQVAAIKKPTLEHLGDFLADLETMGRKPLYRQNTKFKIERLVVECGFKSLSKFCPDAFTMWRSRQRKMAPKTLNEYLNGANSFLNWLVRQGRLDSNPLAKVGKVDVRGRQVKRRALSPEEFSRLLRVSGERRLIYLTAVYTGLRFGELKQLRWHDVRFDVARPHILTRAATTKNKKEAIIPLHPELAAELKVISPKDSSGGGEPVFQLNHHISEVLKRDLVKAKIAPVDELGRKVDFHALRYTFATRLAQHGVSQRVAQELMRHSDANLTANLYTDATQLPTFDAVNGLNWEGTTEPKVSQIVSQKSDISRHQESQSVSETDGDGESQSVGNELIRPVLSRCVTNKGVVVGTGFEPVKA